MLDREADHFLDLRGIPTPVNLLKVTQAFREMGINKVLEIIGRDPDTRIDLIKVLPAAAYEMNILAESNSSYRIQLKKIRET